MKFVLTVDTSGKAITKGLHRRKASGDMINTCCSKKITNIFLESVQAVENFKPMHE